MLVASLRKYQSRAIEAAAVIKELIALAKEMRKAGGRREDLKLSEVELAFCDAPYVNNSVVKVLGEPTPDHRTGIGQGGPGKRHD